MRSGASEILYPRAAHTHTPDDRAGRNLPRPSPATSAAQSAAVHLITAGFTHPTRHVKRRGQLSNRPGTARPSDTQGTCSSCAAHRSAPRQPPPTTAPRCRVVVNLGRGIGGRGDANASSRHRGAAMNRAVKQATLQGDHGRHALKNRAARNRSRHRAPENAAAGGGAPGHGKQRMERGRADPGGLGRPRNRRPRAVTSKKHPGPPARTEGDRTTTHSDATTRLEELRRGPGTGRAPGPRTGARRPAHARRCRGTCR